MTDYLINVISEKYIVLEIMNMKRTMEGLDIIEEYNGDWYAISEDQRITEDFIRIHTDEVSWRIILKKQKLSKEFIREVLTVHLSPFVVNDILEYQDLSMEFLTELIKDYPEEIDWDLIKEHQELTEEFIIRHAHQFDFLDYEY